MHSAGPRPRVSYGNLDRARWNVIDILVHISRKASPAYLFDEFDAEAMESLAKSVSEKGQKVTITAVLLKAISLAQLKHPRSAYYRTPIGSIVRRPEPVAGFTIERVVKGKPAVFFGVIRGAHEKSLIEIAREINAYALNDVENVTQLQMQSLMSQVPWVFRQIFIMVSMFLPWVRNLVNPSTFGLTTLGKFGLQNVMAPNVTTSIFGIGSMEEKPIAVNGEVQIRKVLSLALSVDLNGVSLTESALFLKEVKTLVETGLAGHMHADDICEPVNESAGTGITIAPAQMLASEAKVVANTKKFRRSA